MSVAVARFVLDTDTISYILRGNPIVTEKMRRAAEQGTEFYLCPIVYYEVRRGLLYRDAKRQLGDFEKLASLLIWKELAKDVWEEAASVWANIRRKGQPVGGDADVLIAAYTRRLRATVVSHNTADFARLGVSVTDWFE